MQACLVKRILRSKPTRRHREIFFRAWAQSTNGTQQSTKIGTRPIDRVRTILKTRNFQLASVIIFDNLTANCDIPMLN